MKKLLTLIIIAISIIISATTITLAFIKSDYNQVSTNNVEYIEVYHGTKHGNFMANEENNKTIFNKLINNYNKGTKESMLSSLFQGAYSSDAKAEILRLNWTFNASSDKTYVAFTYNEDSLPKIKLNGKIYEDENKIGEDKTVTYKAVFVEVQKSSSLVKITAYFIDEDSSDNKSSDYRVQFVAHHDVLYDYIADLDEDSLLF